MLVVIPVTGSAVRDAIAAVDEFDPDRGMAGLTQTTIDVLRNGRSLGEEFTLRALAGVIREVLLKVPGDHRLHDRMALVLVKALLGPEATATAIQQTLDAIQLPS